MAHGVCHVGRRSWLQAALASAATVALAAPSSSAAPPIRLSLNENPFGPSPLALRAMRGALSGLSRFYGLAALPLGYVIAPTAIARSLREQGLGSNRSQNRLAVVAARASLEDAAYAPRVRRQVAEERARWFDVLDRLPVRRSDAAANFVFFHAGRPQPALAAAFAERGIDIGRAFPPLDDWARISIGSPQENARAQRALRGSCRADTRWRQVSIKMDKS